MSCTVTKYKQRLAKIRQAPRVLVCELHTANPNVAVDYYVSTTQCGTVWIVVLFENQLRNGFIALSWRKQEQQLQQLRNVTRDKLGHLSWVANCDEGKDVSGCL